MIGIPRPNLGVLSSLAEGGAAARAYVQRSAANVAAGYPGVDWGQAEVRYVDAGIMNYVYQVDVPGRRFFLKQALDRVKQHESLGPELTTVSPARIAVEARALGLLRRLLPARFRGQVPAVAWHDRENRVLWTEELGAGSRSYYGRLSEGDCDIRAAAGIGRLLGAIHRIPLAPTETLWPTLEEDRGNWERFLRLRTVGVLPRAGLTAAAEGEVRKLYRQGRREEREGMLSHLDAAPKNVLVQADGSVALLDFELGAAVSDPAYDVGFLVGHIRLMGLMQSAIEVPSALAVDAVIRGYEEEAGPQAAGWKGRVQQYAGMTLLYRLCGSSPDPNITRDIAPRVRGEGIRLLLGGAE